MADLKKTDVEAQIVSTTSSASSLASQPDAVNQTNRVNLEKFGEQQGYVLDEAKLRERLGLSPDTVLKKDSSERVLVPQPSSDPQDPLNWSQWKKYCILLVVSLNSFTGDYSSAAGASAILPQSKEWNTSTEIVSRATAGNAFMLAVGGLATVWLSAYIGRLPVVFYFQLLAVATAAWCAAAQNYGGYAVARVLNGFFNVAAAGGGLMWINDLFFFHQRPRMITIWSTCLIVGPFLGPQIMAAIIDVSGWRAGLWLNCGINALALSSILVLGDETFYPRHLAPEAVPPRKSRLMRILGVEQFRSHYTGNTLLKSGNRLFYTITKLPAFLICLFYFFDFPWTIANNITISVFVIPEYNMTFMGLATLYCAPLLGGILALVVGQFLFDFVGQIYARYHNGRIDPEARIVIVWLALPLKLIGYNLIGTSLQQHWSIWVLAVGWGMHQFSTIMTTSAVGAYLIDAYPEASGESAAWLNASRNIAGFIIAYLQIKWATAQGTQTAYGIQSAIMAGTFLIIVYMQFFGAKLRQRCGRLNFKTN